MLLKETALLYHITAGDQPKSTANYGIIRRMESHRQAALAYILPFAAWMVLMFMLPQTASAYAIRSAATLCAGIACLALMRSAKRPATPPQTLRPAFSTPIRLSVGGLAGVAVCALWILLTARPFPEPAAPDPSPYAPGVCGWALTVAKLAGSAFVIAPVEEVFFRSFLYRWLIQRDFLSVPMSRFDLSAFLWTVLLFTLEHDRPVAAAVTGALYGLLAIRMGIGSAISAHVTTNLLLGLYVIHHNAWQFW